MTQTRLSVGNAKLLEVVGLPVKIVAPFKHSVGEQSGIHCLHDAVFKPFFSKNNLHIVSDGRHTGRNHRSCLDLCDMAQGEGSTTQ